MKCITEERWREKLEEKRSKQKLKEEIVRDRAEIKAKNKSTASASEGLGKNFTTAATLSPQKKITIRVEYSSPYQMAKQSILHLKQKIRYREYIYI